MTLRRSLLAAAACLALAAASLLVADEPVYDAWAWLVWGRELAGLGLETSSGPAWKPLPVVLAIPLSLAGDAAPQLWLVLVRAAWLASLLLAAELSWTLSAGRPPRARLAGAGFAAVALALLSDDVTHWARQAAGGMSEPVLVALVLGAVRAALAGRPRPALALGALAALVRPEAWPLLALYALWISRADRRARPLVAGLALGVATLWLAPALLGTGGGGAGRAQVGTSGPLEALLRAEEMPLAAAWPLAIFAARRDAAARVLSAGALGWIALVAAMTLLGFPGLPRFTAPAAAVIGVVAGAGLAGLLAEPPRHWVGERRGSRSGRAVLAVAAMAGVVTLAGLPNRIGELGHVVNSASRISDSHDRLRALAGALGRERLLACGRLATSDVLVRTALAWKLRVPLGDVVSFGAPPRQSGAFLLGLQASPALRAAVRRSATPVAREGEWAVYSIDCPATTSSSPPARTAGVVGATR